MLLRLLPLLVKKELQLESNRLSAWSFLLNRHKKREKVEDRLADLQVGNFLVSMSSDWTRVDAARGKRSWV